MQLTDPIKILRQIKDTNIKLRKYCEDKEFNFVDNYNIHRTYLNSRALHINNKGPIILIKKIRKSLHES